MGAIFYFFSILFAFIAYVSFDMYQTLSQGSIFKEYPQSDFSSCERITEIKGCEDLVIHQLSGYALAGCPEDYMSMTNYMSLEYKPRTSLELSKNSFFVSYNIQERKAVKLSTTGFPDGINFHVKGVDIIQDSKNEKLLHVLAINHRGNATDTVEHFKYSVGSSEIEYVESFESDCLRLINNLAATSPSTFYYSQDLSHASGPLFFMENAGLLAGGKLMHYGGKDNCQELASGFKYANGVSLSSDRKLVYLVETFRAKLHIFERDSDNTLPDLEAKEQVPLKFIPDNIQVDQSSGHVYIAGFSTDIKDIINFARYDGKKNVTPVKGVAARVVNETGEGRFFGQNYRVEPIMVDHGDTMFSTSVAAADETRGALLLSGLFTSRGMLDCRPPGLKHES